jgi:hypothetical protein
LTTSAPAGPRATTTTTRAPRAPRAPRGIARTAAATATALDPAAPPAPGGRPALSLVPTPHEPAPTAGPRSISRKGVEELASAGAGHVTQEPDGMATIDFTGRPGTPYIPPFSTAPVTVSRLGLGDVTSAATSAASGLRDSAVSQGQGLVDHGREMAQQQGGQLVDRGADYAHGLVDHAASSVHDVVGGGSPEDAKAKADEMYDEMLTRLRRDLVSELEAGGNLLRHDL